jgi:hypothetical protein
MKIKTLFEQFESIQNIRIIFFFLFKFLKISHSNKIHQKSFQTNLFDEFLFLNKIKKFYFKIFFYYQINFNRNK